VALQVDGQGAPCVRYTPLAFSLVFCHGLAWRALFVSYWQDLRRGPSRVTRIVELLTCTRSWPFSFIKMITYPKSESIIHRNNTKTDLLKICFIVIDIIMN